MADHRGPKGHVDVPTDHEYDGIREFDNPLPMWWLLTFFGAIAFAGAYWLYYHNVPSAMGSREAYAAEWAEMEAAIAAATVDEATLVAMKDDSAAVATGRELYVTSCKACHGDKGEGGVGPNLTDDYWIAGAGPKDLYVTVSNGRLDKGMPAWKASLGAERVSQVVAYLLTIQGTNVPGKEPQGEQVTAAAGN